MAAVHRRTTRAAWGFLTPFLVLFAATFLLPIGYAIYESLHKNSLSGPLGLGGSHTVFAGLSNYSRALGDAAFLASVRRVLLYAVVQVPVMILLAVALALLLDTVSARAVRFFRATYFMPYGVPGVIASILWGFLYTPGTSPVLALAGHAGLHPDLLGGGSVLWSIANIVTWEFAGYNMLVVTAQLQAIPGDLYEAARTDGASAWQIARRVKLPLLRPAIVLTTVFTIIGTLQLFAEPLILKPVSTGISNDYTPNLSAYNSAFANNDYYLASAKAVLLAVAAFVLSFGFLRLVGRRGGASR
ncbi:carbohydrate ABC transporter permease [Rugosimonospora africana]|uniref:Sugar ABC transporter permease n=1 Tax=Rugosimonospora africana TaxID=556532 RepID=A0A8J3QQP0_9ACTN|nr:sugar ABC transporter permease [Rugosimonospora africana]GIH15153.1 sugar ABC transporter permease [Rugosimonospora africana]